MKAIRSSFFNAIQFVVVVFAAILLAGVAAPVFAQIIPAGATFGVRLDSNLSTEKVVAGTPVLATFVKPLRENTTVVIPEGSRYHGKVEHVEPHGELEDAWMRLVFDEIELAGGRIVKASAANSFSASKPRRGRRYALFVGIGTAAGALIGGGPHRMTGILGGALAGFIFANNRNSSPGPLELRAGQTLALHLTADITLR